MNIDKIEKLADIIIKVKIGIANDNDRVALDSWLNEKNDNIRIYSSIMSGDFLASKFMMEDELEQIYNIEKIKQSIISKLHKRKNRRTITKLVRYSAAAVICAFLAFAGTEIYKSVSDRILLSQNTKEMKDKLNKVKHNVSNESAVLITSNGEEIPLKTSIDGIIANSSAKLDAANSKKPSFSTLVTPKGINYNLTLPDGTNVWLNEKSKLTYPVAFNSDKREVNLTGEAYFEVKEDTTVPFIVNIENETSVRVLGTKFNIKSNKKESMTTLVEGSVEVAHNNTKITIKPSQQAKISEGKEHIEVAEVDIRMFTAWKEGKYYFKNEPINVITNTISDWYDVQFEYDNEETAQIKFTGILEKKSSFSDIIEIIEATKLFKVRMKGDNIIKLYKE